MKESLAYEIAVLLKIKDTSEQKGRAVGSRKEATRRQKKNGGNLLKIATASSIEMERLLAIASNLSKKGQLQEQFQRCDVDWVMKSKLVAHPSKLHAVNLWK